MGRRLFSVLAVTIVAPGSVLSQTAAVEVHALAATNRSSAVTFQGEPGRGFGAGAVLHLGLGRLHFEGNGVVSSLTRSRLVGTKSTDESWDFTQVEFRARFDVVGPLAIEVSAVRQFLKPDFNGNETGYVAVGAYGDVSIGRDANLWGRLGLIPSASFTGGGGTGFSAETQIGFGFAVSDRLSVVGRYSFQRVDRELPGNTSEVEFDLFRFGVKFALSGGAR